MTPKAQAFPCIPWDQPSLALHKLAVSSPASVTKMGSHRHSYTPVEPGDASLGALKPPPASHPTHLWKGALPKAAPPGSSPRCCPGTVQTQGTSSRASRPPSPSGAYHGGAAVEHSTADLR